MGGGGSYRCAIRGTSSSKSIHDGSLFFFFFQRIQTCSYYLVSALGSDLFLFTVSLVEGRSCLGGGPVWGELGAELGGAGPHGAHPTNPPPPLVSVQSARPHPLSPSFYKQPQSNLNRKNANPHLGYRNYGSTIAHRRRPQRYSPSWLNGD